MVLVISLRLPVLMAWCTDHNSRRLHQSPPVPWVHQDLRGKRWLPVGTWGLLGILVLSLAILAGCMYVAMLLMSATVNRSAKLRGKKKSGRGPSLALRRMFGGLRR